MAPPHQAGAFLACRGINSIQLLDSMGTSLLTDQEVLGSISGSAMGFFSSGELIQDIYGLGVCVCRCLLITGL